MSLVGLLLFTLVVVGLPYTYFISRACEPSGISEFFSAVLAFHSREGC